MTNEQKVSRGEPFRRPSADLHNTLVDVAAAFRASQMPAGPLDDADLSASSATVVRVKNTTGALLPRGSVLRISGSIRAASSAEWRNAIELQGAAPASGHAGRFVVLREHAPAGGLAEATAAGVCQVDVKMDSASHRFADLEAGRTDRLVSGETGSAFILWAAGTSGVQKAIVRLLGPSSAAAPVYEIVTSDQGYNLEYPSTESPPGYALLTPDPLLSGGGIDVYRGYTYVANHCLYHAGQCFERVSDDKTLRCTVAGSYWCDFAALVEDRWTQPTTFTTTSNFGGFQTVADYNKSLIELRLQVAYAGTATAAPNWSNPFSVSYPGGYRYSQLHLRRMRCEDHVSVSDLRKHTIEGADKIDLAVGSEVRLMLQLRHYGTFNAYTDSPCRLWYSQLHMRRMGDVPNYTDPTPLYGNEWEPSDE